MVVKLPQNTNRLCKKAVEKKMTHVSADIVLFCSEIVETLRKRAGSAPLNHNK